MGNLKPAEKQNWHISEKSSTSTATAQREGGESDVWTDKEVESLLNIKLVRHTQKKAFDTARAQ